MWGRVTIVLVPPGLFRAVVLLKSVTGPPFQSQKSPGLGAKSYHPGNCNSRQMGV